MQRAVSIIAKSFIGLFVVLSVSTVAAAGYARLHGLVLLSVQTGSMQPAISPGDVVLVRQRPVIVATGDIISFRSHDNPKLIITHRIVSTDSTGRWMTMGDASSKLDKPVRPDQLVGRVERVLPLVGYGFDFIRQPVGLVVSVHIPALVLAGSEIQRLSRYYESRRYRLYRPLRV